MLTDSKIKRFKPSADTKKPDKYSDGNGLQLHVFPHGRMTWIYAYRFNGKQKNINLGTYTGKMTGHSFCGLASTTLHD